MTNLLSCFGGKTRSNRIVPVAAEDSSNTSASRSPTPAHTVVHSDQEFSVLEVHDRSSFMNYVNKLEANIDDNYDNHCCNARVYNEQKNTISYIKKISQTIPSNCGCYIFSLNKNGYVAGAMVLTKKQNITTINYLVATQPSNNEKRIRIGSRLVEAAIITSIKTNKIYAIQVHAMANKGFYDKLGFNGSDFNHGNRVLNPLIASNQWKQVSGIYYYHKNVPQPTQHPT